MSDHIKIGIALSGGGSRGLVHVGVLQALEDHGVEPNVVSGTSAGSMVGALYAYGYSPKEIYEIANQKSLIRMFSLTLPSKGFVSHNFLRKIMRQYLPEEDYSSMKKPLFIVLANMNTGKPDVFNDGPLIEHIAASSSIPILFQPVLIDGQTYLDGGLLMNLPASPLKPHCDMIIGVNLVPRVKIDNKELKSVIAIGIRSFNLAALNNIMPELSYCDVVVEPEDIHRFSRFNFSNIKEMYEIGYEETVKHLDEIKSLIEEKSERKSMGL